MQKFRKSCKFIGKQASARFPVWFSFWSHVRKSPSLATCPYGATRRRRCAPGQCCLTLRFAYSRCFGFAECCGRILGAFPGGQDGCKKPSKSMIFLVLWAYVTRNRSLEAVFTRSPTIATTTTTTLAAGTMIFIYTVRSLHFNLSSLTTEKIIIH